MTDQVVPSHDCLQGRACEGGSWLQRDRTRSSCGCFGSETAPLPTSLSFATTVTCSPSIAHD